MSEVASDGSPVEFYRRLPEMGEVDVAATAIPYGSSILELGCGAGRLTRSLVARGYRVTGVDDSAAMIEAARLRAPEAAYVVARFDELALDERFDVALLASHLVNDPATSEGALAASLRHVGPGGIAVVEAYPPGIDWTAQVGRTSYAGDARVTLIRAETGRGSVRATVRYAVGGEEREQSFTADLLDEAGLRSRLEAGGFAFDRWIDRDRGWLLAGPKG